jgi:hypothetical protein
VVEAGRVSQIRWADGNWIFLDVGFSNKAPSCGLLVGDAKPSRVQFYEAKRRIVQRLIDSKSFLNLVIEAPLSVCFNSLGNPSGRSIEIEGSQTRYWYYGAGCTVMTAAMYLIRDIHETEPRVPVRLFEGFVS